MIWRSALFSAPFGLTSIFFVPEYWHPIRVVEFICGPEDIIFSFANGGMVWAAAMGNMSQQKWRWDVWQKALRRYLLIAIVGMSVSAILGMIGVDAMPAALVPIYGVAAYVLWRRPRLIVPALRSITIFGLIYGMIFAGSVFLWPHFIDQWNRAALSGISIGLMPLEELGWGLGFGLSWPLFMAIVFNADTVKGAFTKNLMR